MGDSTSSLQLVMILKNLNSLRSLNSVFLFWKLLRHRQSSCLSKGATWNYSDIFLMCGYYVS